MTQTSHNWRPTDLEAIRQALRIPVSPAAIRAINEAMAELERSYPAAIPAARAHLDAIAAFDHEALAQPSANQPPAAPVIRKVTRKGAAGAVPEQLPRRKVDVIEYATDLLLEEISTEYATSTPPPPRSGAMRQLHVDGLLLILPRLECWMPPTRTAFSGPLIRG